MSSTTDKIKGLANEAVGNVKQGCRQGDRQRQARGRGQGAGAEGRGPEDGRRRQGRAKNLADKVTGKK